ncbi:hypothetical protein FB192DRAFT_1029296 [Mucor lusitanicus]|uniref:Uncharacterized protein n=1 Tax=Mucor circinelloides f. lusitanicus TaxID=29924 RepID=A0A8H4EWG2_MUCCL|nr:hypothetical protein FB192DRAFT_1029296 [Mucor lusitanicus]
MPDNICMVSLLSRATYSTHVSIQGFGAFVHVSATYICIIRCSMKSILCIYLIIAVIFHINCLSKTHHHVL